MKKLVFAWLSILGILFYLIPVAVAAPTNTTRYNDWNFSQVWKTTDKPVKEIPGLGRGYIWGPPVSDSESITVEYYNGFARKIQYFDKARMEVGNFNAKPSDPYKVTTGLLVKELVTGQRQDGDNTFTPLPPSNVQVAGDPNSEGANSIAPTYSSFRNVITFNGENTTPDYSGKPIAQKIERDGKVTEIIPHEQRYFSQYDSVTQHNVADVFASFEDIKGKIWNGKSFEQANVMSPNPVYVLGRPVTEAYWTRVVTGGAEKDVLVQLFERRVLSYTPSNPDGFKVEMGNVGQHYYYWRYVVNKNAPAPAHAQLGAFTTTPVEFTGKGKVQDVATNSRILNKVVNYRLYLPPDYDKNKNVKYPTLYMLHGRGGSYQMWFNLGLVNAADDLINSGKIPPMIIIMPDGGELGYWMDQANGGPRWADFVAIELVGQIDSNYRTLPERAERAIGGVSMGGHGALQIGFNNPSVFSIIGAHSPALRTKQQAFDFFGDQDYYATVDPVSLARSYDVSSFKIWIDIGTEDADWLPRDRELHQLLDDENIPHSYHEWSGGHTAEYWNSHVKDYMLFYGDAFNSQSNYKIS
ncbi:MAG: hypothetical protein HXX08_05580 [Chloroflexi bacterium]|uniref:Esterase family protein n=1 Tax=Candidatus Chlorohelix allophototropha TaxID=3003348 RepID=A0A8T7LWJ4_9CHLR|nr:hypothetical protein [Chloroflexota bacterium]WJW67206.1 esterase family protein [Chloroflexota bacterium L227-S17]